MQKIYLRIRKLPGLTETRRLSQTSPLSWNAFTKIVRELGPRATTRVNSQVWSLEFTCVEEASGFASHAITYWRSQWNTKEVIISQKGIKIGNKVERFNHERGLDQKKYIVKMRQSLTSVDVTLLFYVLVWTQNNTHTQDRVGLTKYRKQSVTCKTYVLITVEKYFLRKRETNLRHNARLSWERKLGFEEFCGYTSIQKLILYSDKRQFKSCGMISFHFRSAAM